ncbi:MAG: DUF502 domain-containing protein [bacterium]|nr:DUF502 domain-containing protein [bacterium]
MNYDALDQEEVPYKRSLRARIAGGLIVLALLLLFGSLLKTHLADPALSFWEPIFVRVFGATDGSVFGFLSKFWLFLLFSLVATLCVAGVVETFINSRWFAIQGLLFRKVPVLKHIFSFAQGSASAYRNLKRARSIFLRIKTESGEVFVPAFITKELALYTKGTILPCFVVYCPHTPTFLTGNTFVVPKKYERDGGIIDVPANLVIENVVSAGIFGKAEEMKEELEKS